MNHIKDSFSVQEIGTKPLPNYGQALRMLRNTETLVEQKKKQLKIQLLKAQKGSRMEYQRQHHKKVREQAKESNQKSLIELKNMKQKERERVESIRRETERIRKESMKNRSKSRIQIMESKMRQQEEIKKKTIEHQEKIKQFKKEMLQKKQHKRLQLYKDIHSSRLHVNQYQQQHANEVKTFLNKQRDDLMSKILNRQRELYNLNKEIIQHPTINPEMSNNGGDRKSKDSLPYGYKSTYIQKRKKSISLSKMESNHTNLPFH